MQRIGAMSDSAAVSAALCMAVVDCVLNPASEGQPPTCGKSEWDAVLVAVTTAVPACLALFERWLDLSAKVCPCFAPRHQIITDPVRLSSPE